jgi:GT2 family glycosyltransferase
MTWPTARNLSLPRSDLERTGLFDERFRTTCEDQDLAERARAAGIRFIYDDSIDCLHNDAAAELKRYCRFQERGASDTVLYLMKSPLHKHAAIAVVNGPLRAGDTARLLVSKSVKRVLAASPFREALYATIAVGERLGVPERALRRAYTAAIGVSVFRGWRSGLKRHGGPEPSLDRHVPIAR